MSSKLSYRAELFRSKLIQDFQLLETMNEQKRQRAPTYNSSDVLGDSKLLKTLLIENPQQTIKFQVYNRKRHTNKAVIDRRLMRIKNQSKLPLGVWAHWIVKNDNFQKLVMTLIVINCISIGIQGELPKATSSDSHVGLVSVLKKIMEFIGILTVIAFILEIALKWIDNFKLFWTNAWNILDLLITILSIVSHILILFSNEDDSYYSSIVDKVSAFRVLQSLKLVSKFSGLRIIVFTILRAFQSMIFIAILLSIIAYIFAVVGVMFFETYSNSDRDNLAFKKSFNSLHNTLITLFQLFTLDQWYALYKDLTKESDPVFTCIYILLWIWVGSFVFRNLIVGIMAEITRHKDNQDHIIEVARLKEELHSELIKHDQKKTAEQNNMEEVEHEEASDRWDHTVRSYLAALASDPGETLWPRDTLFRYIQLLELLQENMEEFENMQTLAIQSILNIHNNNEVDNDTNKNISVDQDTLSYQLHQSS